MCLLFHKNTPIRTATKDIVVYKLLNTINIPNHKYLYSPFRHKKWIIGIMYNEPKLGIFKTELSSFNCDNLTSARKKWGSENIWSVREGFHSSKTKERIKNSYYTVYKCIIPAGAKYITGIDGLMASDKLRVIEKAE